MLPLIYHLQNISALHVGSGQDAGIVDQPLTRAKATNLPLVPGSSIKGVLRQSLAKSLGATDTATLFGPHYEQDTDFAGALACGDAHLLLLPIRSLAGTVAYATCRFILLQYQRDLALNDLQIPLLNSDQATVAENSALMIESGKQYIGLEDLDIEATYCTATAQWANYITKQLYPDAVLHATDWRELVKQRFVVLPDNIFSFLAETATEVRTRIRIDSGTRVVADGALWTEEYLPAETVLWGVLGLSNSRNTAKHSEEGKRSAADLRQLLTAKVGQADINIQLGGKHTVGNGVCRFLIQSELNSQ